MMIKKWVCFVIILITGFCGYTGMAIAKNYPDVPTIHPYCQAVDFVTDYDMIPKVHEKEFKPDDPVVRGEAAQFLCRTVNFARADRSNSFADITADDIFGQEAGRLAQNDILDDSELFLFRPYDTITYGEALRWMIHAAGYRQEAMDAGGYPMGYLAVGQDQNFLRRIDISDSEQWMTRGDMAQLLYNFCVRTGQGGIGGNDVGGIMSRDTVWKKENGPYIIRQPLTVAAGVRLKAEAGTEIILLDDMIVNGCLQAMGDTNDRIKISVYNGRGVQLKSGQDILSHCDIWDNQSSRDFVIHSNSIVSGCRFFSLQQVVTEGQNQHLKDNELIGCQWGIQIASHCVKAENMVIQGGRYGMRILSGHREIRVDGCKITDNIYGLIPAGEAEISECLIENNDTGVIISDYRGELTSSQIRGNNTGILNLSQQNYLMKQCNIMGNTVNAVNRSVHDISLQENYWGILQEFDIQETITDGRDNADYGRIAILPFLQKRYDAGSVLADKKSGVFHHPLQVFLTAVGEDYDIYYTVDGSDPIESGIRYTDAIILYSDTVLKAAAVKNGLWEDMCQYVYYIDDSAQRCYTLKNLVLYDSAGILQVFPSGGGQFLIRADVIKNDTDKNGGASAFFAAYDKNGGLIACDECSVGCDMEEIFFTLHIPEECRMDMMKLFIWERTDYMSPASNVLKIYWDIESG